MSPVSQVLAIARMELRRVFFSRRSFWVYLLALFPTVIFMGHVLEVKLKRERWGGANASDPAALERIKDAMTVDQVFAIAGEARDDRRIPERIRKNADGVDERRPERRYMVYSDGKRRLSLRFEDGTLADRTWSHIVNFEQDRQIYAGMFHYFYLRLGIFFGCLGIFINLFRGEMLDRSLHFWFLAPVKREILLLGKYAAGLAAATLIFGMGAATSFLTLLLPQDPAEVSAFWNSVGPEHLFWYVVSAALACLGYGSIFLASGLLLRNPIVPAITILLWDSVNGFLPELLQKFSVLHYLQSLCPVPAPMPPGTNEMLKLFLAPAAPTPAWIAISGLVALTALVLWAASRAIRRLEINYGTE